MPSKLEMVMNRIAQLQQMRSAGALSESEYEDLKETAIGEALPGNHGISPALDGGLPYDDRNRSDASGLKGSILMFAILTAIAAAIGVIGYYHVAPHGNAAREAGRKTASAQSQSGSVAKAAPPAATQPPQPPDAEPAAAPSRESQPIAPQAAEVGGAPKSQPADQPVPTAIGQCVETAVAKVARRGYDAGDPAMSNFGSAIQYKNGARQVSNTQIGGIDASMPGDKIQLCLMSRPNDCPTGRNRAAVYHALNLRTGQDWDAPNSEHVCGT